ncbi:hypothetical protein ACQKKK_08615 [Peribacillus sp. NPDC006672]|uniref:hypothetical protein n=1 Tax=Peribacillus sp. NPDC006672 TaxID=3390606 RepID=UPI003CFC0CF9
MAISKGHIPKITVNKVEGMRYGFADFSSVDLVKETVHLPEEFCKLSDKHQFKRLKLVELKMASYRSAW